MSPDELLSRFILKKRDIRANGTLRADGFIPFPHSDLSVTRHKGISTGKLWSLGKDVARARKLTLQGRGDLTVKVALDNALNPQLSEPPENHVNLTGWPEAKEHQKLIAIELAKNATFIRYVE